MSTNENQEQEATATAVARSEDRKTMLRGYAAQIDFALDNHGTPEGVAAMRKAHAILDDLGDLTDADYGVINLAKREYAVERTAGWGA